MSATVHILATVRKPELRDAALLVFRTLRTGFPAARVCVWGNALDLGSEMKVSAAARECGAGFTNLPAMTVHDRWIEGLIEEAGAPFWILDTDVIFWDAVEDWALAGECLMAGRFEPEFDEESTRTRHVERLHTSLMWFNAPMLRAAMRAWMARIPPPWGHTAEFPFVRQHFVPVRGQKPRFYDTCAGLWHAGIGTPFTAEQNLAFEHLHCATYIDLVGPKLSCRLREAHRVVYQDYRVAQGMQKHQAEYYAKLKPHAN